MKKPLSLILALAMCLGIAACGAKPAEPAIETTAPAAVTEAPTEAVSAPLQGAELAAHITRTIASFGDNPDIGNRSCGSAAERQAAEFIETTMQEIGLQNVTVDPFTADTWSFNKGRIELTNVDGKAETLLLGGFATNLTYNGEVEVVYAGRGTEADYEGLDVTGKAVLIDIDQSEDWWINVPAYEAHVRGALCVLACNVSGYAYYDADTIGSQDFCGPQDAVAFAVSQNSSATLRALMDANDGVATVTLDVDSVVAENGSSQNVWGEIPGKSDEVLYFFAHYDGYYHSFFDDASGVGSMLAIADAMVRSGYEPDKTIRFVAHGAEEWGKVDTEYDWSVGAYKMINEVHPEWADNGFAILNIDGMYPVQGHTSFSLAVTQELVDFTENNLGEAFADGVYGLEVHSGTTCWTEDFSYVRAGIPSIVASHANPEEVYHGPAYHSNMDNEILGLDMRAWEKQILLFTDLAYSLDALAVCPMDFTLRFKELKEEYAGDADLGVDGLLTAAAALNEKIAAMNNDYAAAVSQGDNEKAAEIRTEAIALNNLMRAAFRDVAAACLAFDWDDNTILPFAQTVNNIECLEAAMEALDADDADSVADNISGVDYNWYAWEFSQETYEYLLDKMYNKAVGTWGQGMIRFPGENLWSILHADLSESAEKAAARDLMQEALERQNGYFAQMEQSLTEDIAAITTAINEML